MPKSAIEKMQDKSPEEMKAGMDEWISWAHNLGDNMIDMGSPLGNAVKINSEGDTQSQSDINGYSIIEADNIEQAKLLCKDYPHSCWGEECYIEVFECMPMPH